MMLAGYIGDTLVIKDHTEWYPGVLFSTTLNVDQFKDKYPVVSMCDYDQKTQRLVSCPPRLENGICYTTKAIMLTDSELTKRNAVNLKTIISVKDFMLAVFDAGCEDPLKKIRLSRRLTAREKLELAYTQDLAINDPLTEKLLKVFKITKEEIFK